MKSIKRRLEDAEECKTIESVEDKIKEMMKEFNYSHYSFKRRDVRKKCEESEEMNISLEWFFNEDEENEEWTFSCNVRVKNYHYGDSGISRADYFYLFEIDEN